MLGRYAQTYDFQFNVIQRVKPEESLSIMRFFAFAQNDVLLEQWLIAIFTPAQNDNNKHKLNHVILNSIQDLFAFYVSPVHFAKFSMTCIKKVGWAFSPTIRFRIILGLLAGRPSERRSPQGELASLRSCQNPQFGMTCTRNNG